MKNKTKQKTTIRFLCTLASQLFGFPFRIPLLQVCHYPPFIHVDEINIMKTRKCCCSIFSHYKLHAEYQVLAIVTSGRFRKESKLRANRHSPSCSPSVWCAQSTTDSPLPKTIHYDVSIYALLLHSSIHQAGA